MAVCEAHEGPGVFFRIPLARNLQQSTGTTGAALAALLFTMSDASLEVSGVQLRKRPRSL